MDLWHCLIVMTYRYRCQTANFTLRTFHTVKNWYQFPTAREKLVPVRHIFHSNCSHFVEKCARRKNLCSIHAYSSHH